MASLMSRAVWLVTRVTANSSTMGNSRILITAAGTSSANSSRITIQRRRSRIFRYLIAIATTSPMSMGKRHPL